MVWRLRNTVRIDTNRFWTGLITPKLPNSTFSKWEIWESENLNIWKRRPPKKNQYLSGQKCFNFRGVLIGDKTDAWCLMLDAWTPARPIHKGRRPSAASTKGGRPPPLCGTLCGWVWQVFKHQASIIKASSIKHQASSIKPQASSIKHQAANSKHQAFRFLLGFRLW